MATAEFSHMNVENLPIGQHQQQNQHQQLSASSRIVHSHISTDYSCSASADDFTTACHQPFVGSQALAPAATATSSTMVHHRIDDDNADRTETELGDEVDDEEEEEEEDDDEDGENDEAVAMNDQSDLQDCIDALDDVIEQVPASYLDHIIYENYDHNHNHTSTTPTAVHDQHTSTNTRNHNMNIIPSLSSSQQHQPQSAPNHSSIISSTDAIDRLLLDDDSGDNAAGHLLFDQQRQQQQQQESIATDQLYIYSALEQWIAHPEPIHPHIHDPIIYHHYTSSSSYMMLDSFPNEAASDEAAIGGDVKHFIGAGDNDHQIEPEAADQLHRYCSTRGMFLSVIVECFDDLNSVLFCLYLCSSC